MNRKLIAMGIYTLVVLLMLSQTSALSENQTIPEGLNAWERSVYDLALTSESEIKAFLLDDYMMNTVPLSSAQEELLRKLKNASAQYLRFITISDGIWEGEIDINGLSVHEIRSIMPFNMMTAVNYYNYAARDLFCVLESTASYDIVTLEDAPSIMWCELIYDDDVPAIVMAFVKNSDNAYMTKTTLVYGDDLSGTVNRHVMLPMMIGTFMGDEYISVRTYALES